ncbi:hypothetical protein J1792_16065 [Streptomyces triculaminicus]|uniref:Ricin B lectin domain-containing protein n=1 Tax=Streptomyces triculaminicus TaxID=2816232 RepID=A0A939FQL4_9ACTN|nr:hypothetical protein [Streptomyces triculaminicus]MBO0654232.1 hypothetical protein [Streptomyces triculaminicus]
MPALRRAALAVAGATALLPFAAGTSAAAEPIPSPEPPPGSTQYISEKELADLTGGTTFGVTVEARTTDSGAIGGRAHWIADGDKVAACDTQADGKRVRATIYWNDSTGSHYAWVEDANGANGDCMIRNDLDLPEGTKVGLEVCLKSGSEGRKEYCGTATGVA